MSKNQSKTVYEDKDYVQVAPEGAEEPLPDLVPKSWIGTDLLEPGVVEFKGGSTPAKKDVVIPDGAPDDKWTVDQLDLYASEKGVDGYGDAKNKGEKLPLVEAHYAAANPPAS